MTPGPDDDADGDGSTGRRAFEEVLVDYYLVASLAAGAGRRPALVQT